MINATCSWAGVLLWYLIIIETEGKEGTVWHEVIFKASCKPKSFVIYPGPTDQHWYIKIQFGSMAKNRVQSVSK